MEQQLQLLIIKLMRVYDVCIINLNILLIMVKVLIGCTILRAVSGILRTQRGRRGSGPRETSCNRPAAHLLAPVARPSPPWLKHRPCGSFLAPVARLPPMWLYTASSRPCGSALRSCGSTLSYLAGVASSHGPWAVCLGRTLPRQIKPGPSVAAAVIGVQREAGLGWQGLRVATGAPYTLSHLAGVGG